MTRNVVGSSQLPPTVSKARLLHDKSDQKFRQMMYDLTRISAHVERIQHLFAAHLQISAPQFTILMSIAHLGGSNGVEIGRIAQHLHVSAAFATMEVQKLEKRRFVRKAPNPKDQRSVLVHLTSTTHDAIIGLLPVVREINDHFFGVMTKEEFQTFCNVARQLVISGGETVQLAEQLLDQQQRRRRA